MILDTEHTIRQHSEELDYRNCPIKRRSSRVTPIVKICVESIDWFDVYTQIEERLVREHLDWDKIDFDPEWKQMGKNFRTPRR